MKARNCFLSLEARGKFGNIAVANIVRGIQIIKKKKDPANPKTPEQIIQRHKYADGRIKYHSLHFTERDLNAISRRARIAKIKLNPFQMFQKIYLIARKTQLFTRFCSQVVSNSPSTGKLYLYCEVLSGLTLLVGINRSFNQNFEYFPVPEIPGTGKYETQISDLIVRERYYFIFLWRDIFNVIRPCSGIYAQRL